MSNNNRCTYCSRVFSTKGNLQRHQTTNKHCLRLQNNQYIELYTCEYCNYNTSLKHNINRHYKICKKKKEYDKNKEQDLRDKLLVAETKAKMLKEDNDILQTKVNNLNENNMKDLKDTLSVINPEFKMIYKESLENLKIKDHMAEHPNIVSSVKYDKLSVSPEKEKHDTKSDIMWKELENKVVENTNHKFSQELKNYSNTPAIYLIEDPCDPYHRLKYGRTNKLRKRVYNYYLNFKCVAPTVHYYIQMNKKETIDIESMLHKVFRNYKDPLKSEWLKGILTDDAISKIVSIIELYKETHLQPWDKVPRKYKSVVYNVMMNKKRLQTITSEKERDECISMIKLSEQDLPETTLNIIHSSLSY